MTRRRRLEPASAYARRRRVERFLLPQERRGLVCRSKRSFASEDEARSCQPSQRPYLCMSCGRWHLASEARHARTG